MSKVDSFRQGSETRPSTKLQPKAAAQYLDYTSLPGQHQRIASPGSSSVSRQQATQDIQIVSDYVVNQKKVTMWASNLSVSNNSFQAQQKTEKRTEAPQPLLQKRKTLRKIFPSNQHESAQ